MTSIEKHIKDYIECTYNCVFRGNVIVEINGDIYNLALQLNSQLAPINLAIQGTQEQFLEYVKKLINLRALNNVEYYSGYKNYQRTYYPDDVVIDVIPEEIIPTTHLMSEDGDEILSIENATLNGLAVI